MKDKRKYIGDAAMMRMLDYYQCPTPFHIVRLRVAGAVVSPNEQLQPVAVISSFWPQGQDPRLSTQDEAEIFFSAFMGLWQRMAETAKNKKLRLTTVDTPSSLEEAKNLLVMRAEEIEFGFIEGFWGGLTDIDMPSVIAELVDSLSASAESYGSKKQELAVLSSMGKDELIGLAELLKKQDTMVERAMNALVGTMQEAASAKAAKQSVADIPKAKGSTIH